MAPSLPGSVMAQEAHSMATSALLKLEGHEKLCAERWEQMRLATTFQTAEIKEALKGVWARIWIFAGGGYAILLTLVAYLAVKALKL